MENELVTCYNKGCPHGNKFDPTKNKEDSCLYHPGGPIFHEGLKGWSCCKKRTTDFTEFLAIKGCTKGYCSNVKPPEPVKPEKQKQEMIQLEIKPQHRQPDPTPQERPSEDDPLMPLKATVGATLQQALDKLTLKEEEQEDNCAEGEIKIGTCCQNRGCTARYEGEHSNKETCVYHPGWPVFHEGMKYWSCCERKTSDFDAFLNQAGCTTGKHNWVKPKVSEEKKTRLDWHQTPSTVCLSLFAKVAMPERTSVKVNKVKCQVDLVYEGGKSMYSKTFILREAIDPTRSNVKLLGTKVEINLRKASSFSWPSLELELPTSGIPDADDDLSL